MYLRICDCVIVCVISTAVSRCCCLFVCFVVVVVVFGCFVFLFLFFVCLFDFRGSTVAPLRRPLRWLVRMPLSFVSPVRSLYKFCLTVVTSGHAALPGLNF